MRREELIALSIKYQGEYHKLIQAIQKEEKIKGISLDNCLTIMDENYPSAFKVLKYPPLVIYYEGDLSLLKKKIIAVIGSRKACDYALRMTKKLVNQKDEIVISGVAKGIDALAHKSAKETIGILGCGLDVYYPKENKELIDNIKRNHLLLSEYPSSSLPLAHHFPFRNRLIIALASEVYIMQSSFKSGTMTSIKEALEQGKEVYFLPYRLDDLEGECNNTLIEEGANILRI